MDKKLFAQRFKAYRKRAGLTQQETADALDVSSNFIRQIEAGDKLPKLETFEKIPLLFRVPADCLLQDMDKAHCVFAIAGLIASLKDKEHTQLKDLIELLEVVDKQNI